LFYAGVCALANLSEAPLAVYVTKPTGPSK
jgi:hypothetical protein